MDASQILAIRQYGNCGMGARSGALSLHTLGDNFFCYLEIGASLHDAFRGPDAMFVVFIAFLKYSETH